MAEKTSIASWWPILVSDNGENPISFGIHGGILVSNERRKKKEEA